MTDFENVTKRPTFKSNKLANLEASFYRIDYPIYLFLNLALQKLQKWLYDSAFLLRGHFAPF